MSEQLADRKFALFDTAIGICGIVWTMRGVEAVQLPLPDKDKTRMRILQRFGSACRGSSAGRCTGCD